MATVEPTDFSRFSHADLILMLQYGDPDRLEEAVVELESVASFMDTQKATLEDELAAFEPYWSGLGAQDYFGMVRGLVEAAGVIADLARHLRDQLGAAREALVKARNAMPAPVIVTPLESDPTILAAINGNPMNGKPINSTGGSALAIQQALQQALAQFQAAQAAAQTSNAAAVQVMVELANADRTLNASIATVPDAVSAPRQGDIITTFNGTSLSPNYTRPGTTPLFRDVYADGVQSAALVSPGSVAGLVNPGAGYGGYPGYGGQPGYGGYPGYPGPPGTGPVPGLGNLGTPGGAGVASSLGDGALGKGIGGGGIGGGGIGGGGIVGIGGGGGPLPVPTADRGLQGRPPAVAPETIAGAAGTGATGAGPYGGVPFMGGMGAGPGAGTGNGRLAKSWLLEQDPDLWGPGEMVPDDLGKWLGLG
jgi:uncharacterized protein YukE